MRDQLKNEFLLLLSTKFSSEDLRILSTALDLILSNYEIEPRKTELILYGSDISKTVEIYIVSKKIEGLSDKSLYLYKIFLRKLRQMIFGSFSINIRKHMGYQTVHLIPNGLLSVVTLDGWPRKNI